MTSERFRKGGGELILYSFSDLFYYCKIFCLIFFLLKIINATITQRETLGNKLNDRKYFSKYFKQLLEILENNRDRICFLIIVFSKLLQCTEENYAIFKRRET